MGIYFIFLMKVKVLVRMRHLRNAMAVILDGEAEIVINVKSYRAKEGQGIVMPDGIPHTVKSVTCFKMLLTVVKNI